VAYFNTYQLKDPMVIKSTRSLVEHIQSLGDPPNFADELDELTDKVSDIFPQQPFQSDLHIIATLPAAGEWRVLWLIATAVLTHPNLISGLSEPVPRSS
jgi:hypothetical protein